MIQVGILSMQRIANYGSFLQAYGLKSILEDIGASVQFVDYHPGNTLIPPDSGTGIKRTILKTWEAFGCDAPLTEKINFIKYKKNYASKYYPYLGITKTMNYNPELDVLIIGSDEVFNCIQNNTNVGFSPELFGQGNKAKKLITYAASFGNTTIEKIKRYHIDFKIGMWLKEFDTLSVRDNNSGNIIKQLTKKIPEYHLDPVLVYDFIYKCENIPNSVQEFNYIVLYGYTGRFSKEECNVVRSYADTKQLKVFCIGGIQNCCDKFIDCSPFQVITYFKYAECIITDTFHGTILSIITNKQFVSLIRNTGYGNFEKMTDLLERLNLCNRIIININEIPTIMGKKIDYSAVNKLIIMERKKSYEYLKKQINN